MDRLLSPSATSSILSVARRSGTPHDMSRYRYGGEELCLFAAAVNWKRYIRSVVQPYVVGDVLEVGAGIGGTTRVFCDGRQRSWTCLEPDPELAATLERNVG